MKVLFLTHSFPRQPGDAPGSFVLRLASGAGARGRSSVSVVAPAGPGLASHDQFDGVPVERFRYAPRRYETLAYGGNMATQVQDSWQAKVTMLGFLGAEFRSAVRARREFEPDIVHAHWWFPNGLVGTWLGRMSNKPLVTTLHGSDVRLARSVAFSRPAFRHVLNHSAAVTAVSRWLADEAQRRGVGAGADRRADARGHGSVLARRGARAPTDCCSSAASTSRRESSSCSTRSRARPIARSRSTSSATATIATRLQTLGARAGHRGSRDVARRDAAARARRRFTARPRRSSFPRSAKGSDSWPSKRSCARRRSSPSPPVGCPTSCSTTAPASSWNEVDAAALAAALSLSPRAPRPRRVARRRWTLARARHLCPRVGCQTLRRHLSLRHRPLAEISSGSAHRSPSRRSCSGSSPTDSPASGRNFAVRGSSCIHGGRSSRSRASSSSRRTSCSSKPGGAWSWPGASA